ncbi:glycosyltransferase family 4 protein [Variovorax sp. Sphag1AA]|uniref:glycosyltransferase family 4 protein n=1 Tax=Variovorax sp. Sphag1AA TaxID=2587027 RepID=UPI001617B2BB|nr:glycosyltransferase family 4 protein [Variovorax sp. Sphag1AA]MBB3177622.1 glycosyltransferase involved in cell wall biosynthesis [Variovorax sp. Sphag1AA]
MGGLRGRLACARIVKLQCSFLVPGKLDTRTGGFTYDRHIIDGLRSLGWHVDVRSLGEGWPAPDDVALAAAWQTLSALPDDSLVVVDGLAFGAMPEFAEAHARRLQWVALVHHPLALETGLDGDARAALFDSERKALSTARAVVVTSPSTARALAAYDVPAARTTVVEPGTEPAPLATGSGSGELHLLSVANVSPRKGHALLIDALAGLRDRRWVLHCVGSLTMDAECTASLVAAIDRHGLRDRVMLHGEQDEPALRAFYERADAFVLPSFHEGYGMALAEALAHGLPVISTTAGAIPDTVPADAGVLVPPGDEAALRAALQRLMDDAGWRAQLASGARAARDRLPTWADSAARFAVALEALETLADE